MYVMHIFWIVYTSILFFSCDKKNNAVGANNAAYDSIPTAKALSTSINETSGIADSKRNAGFIWAHEDSGNPPQIHLIKHDGTVVKSIYIKGAINRDWEDMILSGNELYIADIGDNNKVHPHCTIYQFAEPASSVDTVRNFSTIQFTYPDGAHDAEAFLVDPQSKHIYIITKNDNPSAIYKLSYPHSTSSINTTTLVGNLAYSGVVSSSLSPDGKEIVVKTYTGLHQYLRNTGESIEQALKKTSKPLPYSLEPQGEAVSFANDNRGYFTLSEKGFGSKVNLYFYRRK